MCQVERWHKGIAGLRRAIKRHHDAAKRERLRCGATDGQQRERGLPKHLVGHATDQPSAKAATPVGGHDDPCIRTMLGGGYDSRSRHAKAYLRLHM